MNIFKTIILGIVLQTSILSFGQNISCAFIKPICTDEVLDFPAEGANIPSAQTTDPNNNYGCLPNTPSPTWYYLELSTTGDLIMELQANNDVDFILYGPFVDYAAAAAGCGTMGQPGGAPIVDCSYSSSNTETVQIGPLSTGGPTTGIAGEVYVLCITNFFNQNQFIHLTQTGGDSGTDCSIVTQCVSNPGTFTVKKNNVATSLDLYLCENDIFSITHNLKDDGTPTYILPNDTVFAANSGGVPEGDFDILATDPTTAQLMWLVYDQDPTDPTTSMTNQDPLGTPGFLGLPLIIPTEDLGGNTLADKTTLLNFIGGTCGTYWFAPVAGDDGIGGNGNISNDINDNGGLHWDKNENGCYLIGNAIKVTFACPIETVATINCGGINGNSMDITLTEGNGNYTILNQGAGNVLTTPIANAPGVATITDLVHNSAWSINITDESNCQANVNGTFVAPTVTNSVMTQATDCPGTSVGSVAVTIGTTGAPALSVTMNGNPIAGTNPYTTNASAGTLVNTIITDANGCTVQDNNTITSASHYIQVETSDVKHLTCKGLLTGEATITVTPITSGTPAGNLISAIWTWSGIGTTPVPSTFIEPITGSAPYVFTHTNLAEGDWSVQLVDNLNCDVTISIEITSPQKLVVSTLSLSHIKCFGDNDGNLTLTSHGGTGNVTYSWDSNNPIFPDITNFPPKGNPNSSSATTNNAIAGTYKGYGIDLNGCKDYIEVILTQPDEIDINVVQDKLNVLCYGAETGQIILNGVVNNQGPIKYVWNLQPFYDNPPSTSNIASGLGIGTYSVKITDLEGCFKIFDYTITQNDSLYWDDLTIKNPICRSIVDFHNGEGQLAGVAARSGSNGNQNITHLWTNNDTGQEYLDSDPSVDPPTTIGKLNPGSYTLVATDVYGCTIDTTIYLDSLSPMAAFEATSPQFTSNYVGTAPVEVTFTNNSTNYAFDNEPEYGNEPLTDTIMFWSFMLDNDPFETEGVTPLSRIYDTEGLYTVCLVVEENMNSCRDTTCIDIQIYDVPSLDVPNVFTPNGDGENDNFFFPAHVITEFECTVYDRWGTEVYKFTSISDAWDGTKFNNGSSQCSDGVYFYNYKGESSNGTKYKGQGDLQLLRGK